MRLSTRPLVLLFVLSSVTWVPACSGSRTLPVEQPVHPYQLAAAGQGTRVLRGVVEGRAREGRYLLSVDTTADRTGALILFRAQYRDVAPIHPDIEPREAKVYYSASALVVTYDGQIHGWRLDNLEPISADLMRYVTPSYGLGVMRPNPGDSALASGMSIFERYDPSVYVRTRGR